MPNLYITALEYTKGATGQETGSLVSSLTRLSSSVAANATSLPLATVTTAQLNLYDEVYIFDGSSSEIAIVSASTSAGASSIQVNAIANAHAAGTVVCADGANGSLGNAILQASSRLESFTQQALLQATYTNEQLPLRSMGAAITSDGSIRFRPRHFPVTAVSAVAIVTDNNDVLNLDATQAIIPTRAMSVELPVVSQVGAGPSLLDLQPPLTQTQLGWLRVTYTAGYAYNALPWDVKQACIWLTTDTLGDRLNPTGAVELSLGKRRMTQYSRGRTALESPMIQRAYDLLTPYRRLT